MILFTIFLDFRLKFRYPNYTFPVGGLVVVFRSLFPRIIQIVLLSLVVSFCLPGTSFVVAHADTITETVTVKDHSGNLLPGAIIGFGYGKNGPLNWKFTETTTTDGNGVAHVTLPDDYSTDDKLAMFVEPAAGDLANSIATVRSGGIKTSNDQSGVFLNTTKSESITVQLKSPTVLLNPVGSDNRDLPPRFWVSYPLQVTGSDTSSFLSSNFVTQLMRTGPFGINVDGAITQEKLSSIETGPDSQYGFNADIQLFPIGSSSIYAPSYFNVTLGTPSTLTLMDPITGKAFAQQPTPDNRGLLPIYPTLNGVSNLPINVINPANSLPLSNNGNNGAVHISKVIDNGNQTYEISMTNIDDAGNANVNLEDGKYIIQVNAPDNGSDTSVATSVYSAQVIDGKVSLQAGNSGSGTLITKTDDRYQLFYAKTTIAGNILDHDHNSIAYSNGGYICINLQKADWNGNYQDVQGQGACSNRTNFAFGVTDPGTYRIRLEPYGTTNSNLTTTFTKIYTVQNGDGGATISQSDSSNSHTLDNHLWISDVSLAVPNVSFLVNYRDETGTVHPLNIGWINIDTVTGNSRSNFSGHSIDPLSSGFSTFLPSGTYMMTVNPPVESQTIAGLIQSTRYTIFVPDNGSAVQLYPGLGAGTSGTKILAGDNSVFPIFAERANISGQILDNLGQPISLKSGQFLCLNLEELDSNNNLGQGNCLSGTGSSNFGFAVSDPGTYRIRIDPTGFDSYTSSYSNTYTVEGSGSSLTITQANSHNDHAGNNHVWISDIRLSAGNLLLKVLDSSDQPLNKNGNNGYVRIFSLDSNGNQRDFVSDSQISDQGLAAATLVNGNYIVTINPPQDGSVATLATNVYIATVNDNEITLRSGNSGTGDGLPLTDHRFILHYSKANISGQIKDSNGNAIRVSGNQYFCVNLEKADSNGNYQGVVGQNNCGGNANFAFGVSDSGNYRIKVDPQGFSALSMAYSKIYTVQKNDGVLTIVQADTSNLHQGDNRLWVADINLSLTNLKFAVTYLDKSNAIQPLTYGYISFDTLLDGNKRSGYSGVGLNPQTPGSVTTSLPDGTYVVTVNPPGGKQAITNLAQKSYTIKVSSNGTVFHLFQGVGISGTEVSAGVDGVFSISAARSNVYGVVVDPVSKQGLSPGPNAWVSVCDQSTVDGQNWKWSTCTNVDDHGAFGLSVTDPGIHRLLIMPTGFNSIATTYTSLFNVKPDGTLTEADTTTPFGGDFGNVEGSTPSIKIRVKAGDQTINNAGVEIRLNNQFVEWDNTGNNGVAAVSLQIPGKYQFFVHPANSGNYTVKEYDVTAVLEAGHMVATADGIAADLDKIFSLGLGVANLGGHVYAPDGTTPIQWAQVVATDLATGQDLWQQSAQTFIDGSWSMSLPKGRYSLRAQPQGGSANYGSSESLSTVTINNSDEAEFDGAAKNLPNIGKYSVNLGLQAPWWSGVVLNPDDSPNSNARVCLTVNQNLGGWFCVNTNSLGQWAMSKPTGFIEFGPNSILQVAPNGNSSYSQSQYVGSSEILPILPSTSSTDVKLHLLTPNVLITVTTDGATPASNVWVNVGPINGGPWLANGGTDSNGLASLNIPQGLRSNGFKVYIDVNNNSTLAATYGQTNVEIKTGTGGSTFATTLTLARPNIRGHVVDPTTNPTGPVTNSNVDLFQQDDNGNQGQWVSNSWINQSGDFTLNAPASQKFTLIVRAPRNGTSFAADNSYTVITDGSGAVSSFVAQSAPSTQITPSSTPAGYQLRLAVPTVIGTVTDPTGAIPLQNSWVSVMNSNAGGQNTNNSGGFALALSNGSDYQLMANVPWGSSTYAPSGVCKVHVDNAGVASLVNGDSTACSMDNHHIKIKLQAPNLTVTILDSHGAPIQNGSVNVDIYNWHTWAQTDANGVANLNVDVAAAVAGMISPPENLGMHVGFHPQWGTTTSVQLDCSSTQVCAGLTGTGLENGTIPNLMPGTPFASSNWIVTLPEPNTRIYVQNPDGTSIGANSWAQIFKYTDGHLAEWMGGSNTDSNGIAVFNIADTSTSTKYAVIVNPTWGSTSQAPKTWDNAGSGYSQAELDQRAFKVGTPNIALISKDSLNNVNLGGWVQVEYADADGNPRSWISGLGFDQSGSVRLNLPDTAATDTETSQTAQIRLTFNPGSGSAGVSTSIYVTVLNGVVSLVSGSANRSNVAGVDVLSVKLLGGNVTGKVHTSDKVPVPVAGAIVRAKRFDSENKSDVIVTSTDSDGNFGMQLDPTKSWKITVLPANPKTGTQLEISVATDVVFTSNTAMMDFALTVKQP